MLSYWRVSNLILSMIGVTTFDQLSAMRSSRGSNQPIQYHRAIEFTCLTVIERHALILIIIRSVKLHPYSYSGVLPSWPEADEQSRILLIASKDLIHVVSWSLDASRYWADTAGRICSQFCYGRDVCALVWLLSNTYSLYWWTATCNIYQSTTIWPQHGSIVCHISSMTIHKQHKVGITEYLMMYIRAESGTR
jgi:hypothetical protein